ncbi:hypothetical protein DOM21_14900 [Bacteriovorax stolpii]|uniref:hypothetical protein n=1 Tax=Bacteriovorax stolpii TaxID=960 RepID=UPI00115A510F|nr:hypothetical protein [Bacteriovorax stolpii]QDK42715.1 hypothetical protein DOM21_14900 [Bacteriovorax stolpii]
MTKYFFLAYLTIGINIFTDLIVPRGEASTFFAPDSDTALLFNLVTTTASQLNELEKLVSNAEKYTGLMEKYNQIARDEYFRAERINYIAQNYVDLSKRDPKDLEQLNSAIRALKSETESFKVLISEYRKDEARNEISEDQFIQKSRGLNSELRFANSQVMRTGDISSTNEAQKVTAQNSALSYKAQVEGNQINSVLVEKISEQNKLLNREMKADAIKNQEREDYYKLPVRGNKGNKRLDL